MVNEDWWNESWFNQLVVRQHHNKQMNRWPWSMNVDELTMFDHTGQAVIQVLVKWNHMFVCQRCPTHTIASERARTHTHTQKAHIYQIVSIYLVDLVESMKLSLKWMFGKNVQRFMAGRCWMAAHRINSNRRWWRRIGWRRKVGWTGSPQ